MHPYSTDKGARQRIAVAVCAIVGALLAYGLGQLYTTIHSAPPWWLDAPGLFGCFGLVWKVYDISAWRWHIAGHTVSGTRNLSGTWNGEITSDYQGGTVTSATLVVRQTATRILVEVSTASSSSYSSMAALYSAPGADFGLRYMYTNRPRSLSPSTMTPHEGVVRLSIAEDGSRLDGDYETDHHRANNTGRMQFTR
jgi:SMODS-associating 2TM, beta-strand rich effector domain